MKIFLRRLPLMLLSILVLASCSSTHTSWKESGAIAVPHTVATIGSLELVVLEDAPRIIMIVRCLGDGSYSNVRISVQEDTRHFHVMSTLAELRCDYGAQDESSGPMITFDNTFDTGDTLELSLEAYSYKLSQRKSTMFYMVGEDSHLHSGAGSVWL